MLSREEQQEYTGFIEAQLREYTFARKIRSKIRNLFVSSARMNDIRGRFIEKTGPFFAEHVRRLSGNDTFMTELQIQHFEQRIRTLPKDTLIRLYNELKRIEQVNSPAVRAQLFDHFCNSLILTYSLNGWFLHIYAEELRKKQQ